MIYLQQGTASKITLTLYERCQNINNPYFTINIWNNETNKYLNFTADDFSPNPYYYNYFTVSVGNISGLTAGKIVADNGIYTYTVWEQTRPYQLSTASAVGLVETGILKIQPASYTNPEVYTNNDTTQTKVYKNI
jgi:hypothetical protein